MNASALQVEGRRCHRGHGANRSQVAEQPRSALAPSDDLQTHIETEQLSTQNAG
jgi:hypothetical protein